MNDDTCPLCGTKEQHTHRSPPDVFHWPDVPPRVGVCRIHGAYPLQDPRVNPNFECPTCDRFRHLPHFGKAILTPPAELDALRAEFGELYDPCPWPRPDGYDGLTAEWGPVSYVNPLFWGGGITAWVRKALAEQAKGKTVIMALPVDGWVRMLIAACGGGADIRYRPDWRWGTPEGEWRKPSRPLILWVLRAALRVTTPPAGGERK